jgi:hypothetical protein
MVMRKTNPGLVEQEQTAQNSGAQKFLEGVPPAKPMKVGPDPVRQAKESGVGYSGTAKHCVYSTGSAAELLDKSK